MVPTLRINSRCHRIYKRCTDYPTNKWRKITSLSRQNDIVTSFWRNNDVIIASRVRWEEYVVTWLIVCWLLSNTNITCFWSWTTYTQMPSNEEDPFRKLIVNLRHQAFQKLLHHLHLKRHHRFRNIHVSFKLELLFDFTKYVSYI